MEIDLEDFTPRIPSKLHKSYVRLNSSNNALQLLRKSAIETDPAWEELEKRLLKIGGLRVVPNGYIPKYEHQPFLEELLERGQVMGPTNKMMKGRDSQCHSNSAELFLRNMDKCRFASGLSLTGDDGYWRTHSWLVTRNGKIIETTEKRLRYYGVIFTKEESEMIAVEELDGVGFDYGLNLKEKMTRI
jgi:hypothetical protein